MNLYYYYRHGTTFLVKFDVYDYNGYVHGTHDRAWTCLERNRVPPLQ